MVRERGRRREGEEGKGTMGEGVGWGGVGGVDGGLIDVPLLRIRGINPLDNALDPLAPILLHLRLLVRHLGPHEELPRPLRTRPLRPLAALFNLHPHLLLLDLLHLLRLLPFFPVPHARDAPTPCRVNPLQPRRVVRHTRGGTGGVGSAIHVEFGGLGLRFADFRRGGGAGGFFFGGGAEGGEDAEVFDEVGGFFVQEVVFFLGEFDVFAVEGLERVDFGEGGGCEEVSE